jgi:hypothetical protein
VNETNTSKGERTGGAGPVGSSDEPATGQSPFFSIVIPTRNRPDKLRYALESCLNQGFSDYEVVVFDNASAPSAEPVAKAVADPRIRYHRSERPLHMANSWETALTKARGRYVIYIGDDDAMLPNALAILKRLIDDTSAEVIRWSWVNYYWPRYDFCPGMANRLSFALLDNLLYEVPSQYVLDRVCDLRLEYWAMPMLYNSVIKADVLRRIRETLGRVFIANAPDVGSGIACLCHVPSFLNLQLPLSICGISEKSNGHAFSMDIGNEVVQDFLQLGEADGIKSDPRAPVPRAGVLGHATIIFDSALQARTNYGLEGRIKPLDRRWAIERVLEDIQVRSDEEAETVIENLAATLADRPELVAWFRQVHGDPQALRRYQPRKSIRYGYDGSCLSVDGALHGITNVAEAAAWAGQLLGYQAPDELKIKLRPFRHGFLKRLRECAKAALGSVPEYYP